MLLAPQLLSILGQPNKAVHITTHSPNRQVITHTRKGYITAMTVQWRNFLGTVHELEVLVAPMTPYDLVQEQQSVNTSKLDITWATGQIMFAWTPSSQVDIHSLTQTAKWQDGEDNVSTDVILPNMCASILAINMMLANPVDPNSTANENCEVSSILGIQILGVPEFWDLFTTNVTVMTFIQQMENEVNFCMPLWRLAYLKIEVKLKHSTKQLNMQTGSSCGTGGRKVSNHSWMTVIGLLSHKRRLLNLQDLAHYWANHLTANSKSFFPITIPDLILEMEAHAMMLIQILYILMMDIVSPWDPRTMKTSSLKI